MKFKKWTKIISVALLSTVLFTACGKPEGVAAEVNGEKIPMEKYIANYKAVRNQVIAQYGEDYLKEPSIDDPNKTMDEAVRHNILKNMVQSEIVRQDAEKNKIVVEDKEVDDIMNQTIQGFGGEEGFKEALQEQGLTMEIAKDNIKNNILVEKYMNHLKEANTPEDKDLEKYFNDHKEDLKQVSASHILVEKEDEAKEIVKSLKGGEDFAKIVKEKSIDEGSKANNGSLGFFKKGDMVPEFEKAAFSMKKGEVSDPVKSQFGYHIIKVEDIKDDYKSLKEDIKQNYANEKIKEHLEKIEKDAKVKEYVDFKEEIPMDPQDVKKQDKESTNAKENTKKNTDVTNNKDGNSKKDEKTNS